MMVFNIMPYNLPYMQSNFTCNPGPTLKFCAEKIFKAHLIQQLRYLVIV